MNKTALITGSNKGIGFETARQLVENGFHVFISGRNKLHLQNAQSQLANENKKVDILVMDVSSDESVINAAKYFSELNILIDVLINNAAILIKDDTSIISSDSEIYSATINTNCNGPLRVTKAFLPYFRSPGRIINISSGGGSMSEPVGGWSPAYCVSKSMLNAITRHLAYELAEMKISVNAVCPGWVKTDMGGHGAPRTVQKGAETPVWLATDVANQDSGKFFRDKKVIPW